MKREEVDGPSGPSISMSCDDHYVCRWAALSRQHVYVVRHVRPISWFATAFNFYVLVSAVKMIETFEPLRVDDYAITRLGGEACESYGKSPSGSSLAGLL
eukprot:CAMPEP_0119062792 /NCGR_PEP_ID=MMETSP1178-20130426/6308_1 /TAXON_ID=33656 /ORGANISM="unid sp, Strain CCMP2000" /LENGTH=99 /DNA_ID=CAMNT_0007044099 /DNA_START=32 /DNA_END=327 /DNA_ORIENTATION=-